MLASLLPGLRDLRAPLAAGLLWLLFGWLVLEPRYADWDKTDTPISAVIALRDTLTPVAFATLASFVAYLIGSISDTLYAQFPRLTLPARRRWGQGRAEDRLFELRMPFLKIVQSWLVEKFAAAERVGLDQIAILQLIGSDLRQVAHPRFMYEPEEVADERVVNERLSGSLKAFEILENWGTSEDDSNSADVPWVPDVALGVTRHVTLEVEVVADNLLDEGSDLFGPIDRLRGEVELRRAVFVPLTALAVLLAVQSSPIWLAGAGVGVVLLYDARTKEEARLKRIQAALTRTPTRSPTIARLDRSIDALIERAREEQAEREKAQRDAEWFAGKERRESADDEQTFVGDM